MDVYWKSNQYYYGNKYLSAGESVYIYHTLDEPYFMRMWDVFENSCDFIPWKSLDTQKYYNVLNVYYSHMIIVQL